jgi:protein-disulfide isomerase
MTEEQQLTRQERRALRREEKNSDKSAHARRRVFRRVGLYGGILALIVLSGWGMAKFVTSDPLNVKSVLTDAVAETDWASGSPAARHILVEYSDFQCPACALYHPIVKQLMLDYGDRLRLVYRHFPLFEIHKNARAAAYAAEAAGRQGKFWEMHDMLFERQKEWESAGDPTDMFRGYARDLGLDANRLVADMGNSEVRNNVERGYQSGLRSGVNSTPTFFLDGKQIANPRGYTDFKDVLDRALGDNAEAESQ